MANERNTEDIVRRHFQQYHDDITLEEQRSEVPMIKRLLSEASKSGSGNPGRPEFIIRFHDAPDLLAVVECKPNTLKHQSESLDKPKEFAVDGALHYASYLSKGFDVLAIATSGEREDQFKVSHFLQLKKQDTPTSIFGNKLLPPSDYVKGYFNNPDKYRQDYESLQKFMQDLNSQLHTDKVVEGQRSILISAILIALERNSFKKSCAAENNPKILAKSVVDSAIAQLQEAGVTGHRLNVLQQEFSFLKVSPILSTKEHELRDIIAETDNKVNSFIRNHKYRDVLGSLYIEFLRYANSDKALGIVLTPPHITELFADIAQVNTKSIVYDNCAGTGGFLIGAMKKMMDGAQNSTQIEEAIKADQLFGVELQSHIYPLAVSNMYIHQDGKSNIELGNCFDKLVVSRMRERRPTVGMLNPPYKANKISDTDEFEYVLNNLSCLQQGGICVAILPMQSALATGGKIGEYKARVMEEHTLEAVFSMPDELFFNSDVSVVSCVMVFTAHKPHPQWKEVFLGYFKDDGFEKRRIGGRWDVKKRWEDVKNKWLDLYHNHKSVPGLSVCKSLSTTSEWAAEAYMLTDYQALTDQDFEQTLHNYSTYLFADKIRNEVSDNPISPPSDRAALSLWDREWRYFNLQDLFDIKGTKTTSVRRLQTYDVGNHYPYVTTSSSNNGVGGNYAYRTEEGGVLTVDSAVAGYCSYQRWDFSASDHVEELVPYFDLDQLLAMFLVTVINAERYRYNYGRKCSQTRLRASDIPLPTKQQGKRPDFAFMRSYIEQRSFSGNCRNLSERP